MEQHGYRTLVVVALVVIGLGGCAGTSSNDLVAEPVALPPDGRDKQTVVVDVVVLRVNNDLLEELTQHDTDHALLPERLLMKNVPCITEHIMQTRILTFDGDTATIRVGDAKGKMETECLVTPTVENDGRVRVELAMRLEKEVTTVLVHEDTRQEEPFPVVNTQETTTTVVVTAGKPVIVSHHTTRIKDKNESIITLVRADIVAAGN